jgi:hypothetical protein
MAVANNTLCVSHWNGPVIFFWCKSAHHSQELKNVPQMMKWQATELLA